VHYLSVRINKVSLFLSYGQIIPAAALLPASISPETRSFIIHALRRGREGPSEKALSLSLSPVSGAHHYYFVQVYLHILGVVGLAYWVQNQYPVCPARVSAYTAAAATPPTKDGYPFLSCVRCRACNHNRGLGSEDVLIYHFYVLGENINHSPRVRGSR
jgi:hypothetical protein